MIPLLFRTADAVINIFFWIIIARALMSWLQPRTYSKLYDDIYGILYTAAEPLLAPVRRLIPPGRIGIDISPLITIILLDIFRRVVLVNLYRWLL